MEEKPMKQEPTIAVVRPEYLPVPDRDCVTINVADMTREERALYAQGIKCPLIKKQLKDCEESQFYQDCKRDRCKEMRDCKEKEEKEAKKQVEALSLRNQELTQHNEAQSTKINELQAVIIQHNELLAKIVARLPPG